MAGLAGCRMPATHAVSIRTVGELWRLSEREASSGRKVDLRGTVTLMDPDWQFLAVQDRTGGVLVEWPAVAPNLRIGDVVEVKGATAIDNHVRSVVNASLGAVGAGQSPPAAPVQIDAVACGSDLYERVQVEFRPDEGTLGDGTHTARFVSRQACAPLYAIGRLFRTYSPASLVGRRVRVRGVPVAFYSPSGKLDHVRLMFESEADVDVLEPPSAGGSGTGGAAGSNALSELQSIQAVKALPPEEAGRSYPARMEGVVTSLNARHDGYFIQDGAVAICIFLPLGSGGAPRPGQRVRVLGRTERGGFAPVVRQEKVQVLGPAQRPEPLKLNVGDVFHGWEENRWVELEGVAAAVVADGPTHHLELFSGKVRLLVWFSEGGTPEKLREFVNARVSVRGVYSPLYTAGGRLTGFRMFATSPDTVKILAAPRESEPRTLTSLSHFDPRGHPEFRIRVAGTVTYKDTSGQLYLQEGDSSLRVLGDAIAAPGLNDRAVAEGFLSPESGTPQLEQVRWLSASKGSAVAPVNALAESLLSGDFEDRLVTVEGFLIGRRTSAGELELDLQAGRSRFAASLEESGSETFAELRPGALVRLTGVCAAGSEGFMTGTRTATVLLRRGDDIVVARPAPWWDLRRALYAALAATLLLILALAWVVRLRQILVAQMELRSRLEDQLRQSQKLESIGHLAGGVAHDFNNYLTVILGYSSLLSSSPALDKTARRQVRTIQDVGEKAAMLTRQLLAFSRKQVLQPVPCDLNDIIAEAKSTLLPLIGEHIEIAIRPGKTEPVNIDPAQFTRVLVNLAANARDAMPNGGKLVLATDELDIEGGNHSELRPGRYVRVSVTDTGVGMDAATRQKIFDPFFTTKERGHGTGLGLAAVFGIVKQSNGHIEVQSQVGHGTCFQIYLPVVEQAVRKGATSQGQGVEGGTETVLVVEDQEAVRTLVRDGLRNHGYKVIEAANARDALRVLDGGAEPIDLLLTDVVMPEMSGPELAKQAMAKRPGIRVLYMSGYLEPDVAGEMRAGDKRAILEKPFTASQAAQAVRRALGGRMV